MCCFFMALVLFGPRLAILIWWLVSPIYISNAFTSWIWPILGIIFLPWTLLMYLIVYPGGLVGFDWIWLGLGLLADIASYAGGAARRRDVPGYSGP
ncbi:MAG: hypothetical protein PVF74_14625 [Anaerolineales bacterium]|jgi:hypothetical protein